MTDHNLDQPQSEDEAMAEVLDTIYTERGQSLDTAPCSVSFIRRPMLISGMLAKGTDDLEGRHLVLVNSEDSEEEQTITLWHEIVHLIRLAGGLPEELHDEKEIEAAARKIAEACPEILEWAFYSQNERNNHE
jgi:hypothetical protein